MDLNMIEMEPVAARKAFLEYKHEVDKRHRSEDEEIMRGYKWLAQGKQLINLTDAMRKAGVDEKQAMPRLAIARADAEWCWGYWEHGGGFIFAVERPPLRNNLAADKWRGVRSGVMPAPPWDRRRVQRAMVPLIPPALRPASDFKNFFILWEAEWQPDVAPKDPALLKHVGGDLYAVLAVWDLTELERAVLGGVRGRLP